MLTPPNLSVNTASSSHPKGVVQGLGNLREELDIKLKEGTKAHALFTSRHVPLPLRPQVEQELLRVEESMGVIS